MIKFIYPTILSNIFEFVTSVKTSKLQNSVEHNICDKNKEQNFYSNYYPLISFYILFNDVIIGKEFLFLVPVTHTEGSYTKFLVSAP